MSDPGLLGARRLREVLERHGVRPTKALGQNFVIDPNTIRKVIDVARLSRDDRVVEIGAGAGSLTLGLAAAAGWVTAVEFDRALLPVLDEVVGAANNVEVVHADVLRLDLASLDATSVVGNLPYNIAATIVLKTLEEAPNIRALTVMTQREVGERLAAGPGTKLYGQASVLVAYDAAATVAARISRNVFFPVPNVDSVLVRIERKEPLAVDRASFARVVKAAFGQRRKSARNALREVAGDAHSAERALIRSGIDPGVRPERITPDGYSTLTSMLFRRD